MEGYHVPVLLAESIEALNIVANGCYADLTLGGGGHARAILEALGPEGQLYCLDRDADALANAPVDGVLRGAETRRCAGRPRCLVAPL